MHYEEYGQQLSLKYRHQSQWLKGLKRVTYVASQWMKQKHLIIRQKKSQRQTEKFQVQKIKQKWDINIFDTTVQVTRESDNFDI